MITPGTPAATVRAAGPGDTGLAVLVFAAFAATACPGVHWLDSGELTASAWTLGVAHPPGEAPWALVARAVMLLPVGDVAFRANLASAGAATATFLASLVLGRTLLRPDRPGERLSPDPWVPGTAAAVGAAMSGAAWLQAVRAEVYALQGALTLSAAAVLATRSAGERGRGAFAVAGLLVGLAAANHPLLLAAALPGLVLLAFGARDRPSGGDLARAVGMAVLGASVVAYLPVRAAASPRDAWGTPDRLADFVAAVTGRTFARNFAAFEPGSYAGNARDLLAVLAAHGGPLLIPLALLGVVAAARRGRGTLGAGLALLAAAGPATVLSQQRIFVDNPDLHGYAVTWIAALLLLAGSAVAGLLAWASGRVRPSLASGLRLAGVLALLAPAVAGYAFGDRGRSTRARTYALGFLADLPPGALVVTAGMDTAFLHWYGARVEDWRPDLRIVHRLLLGHPFYDRDLRARLGERPAGFDTELARRDLPAALRDTTGPTFVEFRERDAAAVPGLVPRGALMEWRGPGPTDVGVAHVRRHETLLSRWLPAADPRSFGHDAHARGLVLHARSLLGAFWTARGLAELAAADADAIRSLDPAWDGRFPDLGGVSPALHRTPDGAAGSVGGAASRPGTR